MLYFPFVDPLRIFIPPSAVITGVFLIINTVALIYILFNLHKKSGSAGFILNPKEKKKIGKKTGSILLLIVLVALVVRIIALWTDINLGLREYYYYIPIASSHSIKEVVFHDISLNMFHQPLYSLAIFCLNKFIPSETVCRLPSLLFGIFTIALLFYFIYVMFSLRIALFASFLLAINPMHIYWSKEISPYALFCFLALLSFYLFYQSFIQNCPKTKAWYCCVIILGFLCHYFMLFVILSQLISFLIIFNRLPYKQNSRIIFSYFLTLTIFNYIFIINIPFLYYVLNNPLHQRMYFQHTAYSLDFNNSSKVLYRLIPSFLGIFNQSTLTSILLIAFFLISLFLMKRNHNQGFIIFAVTITISFLFHFFCHIRAHIGFALSGAYILWDHNIYLVPLIICIWAYLFSFLRRNVLILICLLLIPANIINDFYLFTNHQKPDLINASKFVKSNLIDRNDAFFFPNAWFIYGFFYYFNKDKKKEYLANPFEVKWRDCDFLGLNGNKTVSYYGPLFTDIPLSQTYHVDKLIKEKSNQQNIKRVWFMDIREQFFGLPLAGYQYNEEMLEYFTKNYKLLLTKGFEYIKIYLFEEAFD